MLQHSPQDRLHEAFISFVTYGTRQVRSIAQQHPVHSVIR